MLHGLTDSKAQCSNLCIFPGSLLEAADREFLVANLLILYPDILLTLHSCVNKIVHTLFYNSLPTNSNIAHVHYYNNKDLLQ